MIYFRNLNEKYIKDKAQQKKETIMTMPEDIPFQGSTR